jgi:hypothetical protein
MRDDQPHNVAIAEVRHHGRTARISGSAATEVNNETRARQKGAG